MTIRQFQRTLEQDLAALGAESPRFDAAQLLRWLSGQDQAWLIAHTGDACPEDWQARSVDALHRLESGEPLQYLLGEWEFYGLPLAVGPGVLIPRADTETIVETCLLALAPVPAPAIWDLCSGSGAIALAVQSQRKDAAVTAVDFSQDALDVARANAQRLQLPVHFVQSSWLEQVEGVFDVIASNPPYIREDDTHMPALRHEPRHALTSGEDGLDDIRTIIAQAPAHLKAGGWLLLEHGWDQAQAVQQLLREAGFTEVHSRQDLAGIERCTGGQIPLTASAPIQ